MSGNYIVVGKEVYTHKSVLALVAENRGLSDDPKEIICHKAREAIARARLLGWNGPPFDPKVLASCMGIRTEPTFDLILSDDAELRALDNGRLIIKYNPAMPPPRQNFSIAHEIAHTFFPDYRERILTRRVRTRKYFDPDDELEMLCDTGGAELLMPFPEFYTDVQKKGISIDSLEELREMYGSSRPATAIRMVQTDIFSCAVVLFDYSLKPSEVEKLEQDKMQIDMFPELMGESPTPKLRVHFAISASSFQHFIPRHKSVNEDTPIYRVSRDCPMFKGNCCLELGTKCRNFYIEAAPMPVANDSPVYMPGVIAFFFDNL